MAADHKIRVLIVDDHQLVRAGIAALLRNERDIQVVGEADSGEDALQKVRSLSPDIVLMDISMPTMDGIETTRRIKHAHSTARILVLTQYEQEEYIKRVIQSGASGYLLKTTVVGELIRAIRAVSRGEQFFAPSVSRVMVDSFVRRATGQVSETNTVVLTHREEEILRLVAEGHTNQQIGDKLHISVRTVEFHRANLNEKLGVHDTASLVRYAIQKKIISLDV